MIPKLHVGNLVVWHYAGREFAALVVGVSYGVTLRIFDDGGRTFDPSNDLIYNAAPATAGQEWKGGWTLVQPITSEL